MIVSAPGKLMLFGEHAVMYGKPCIVTAIDQRLSVSEGVPEGDTRFLDAAVAMWGKPGMKLAAHSMFTGTSGLGSSSAVTVAALKYLRPDASPRDIFNAAYKIILQVQGTGSGFDAAAASYGGTMYFMSGGKTIEPLDVDDVPAVVGFTGVKADTATMISSVAAKMASQPERVGRIFDAIAKITEEAKTKLIEGDWERVGTLMNFNQDYLRDLGVSSERLEALISAAKGAGAFGAKLSGAGGGDCMIAIVSEDRRKETEYAITEAGGQVIHAAFSASGVRIESDNQNEQLIVVDGNDNVLGHKSRYECHHDPTVIHRAVELFIFDDNGRILLQKRSVRKDTRPGYWSTSVGGHVENNETYEETMARELKEELGIETPVTYHSKRIVKYPNETEMEALFTATHNGPFHPYAEEVDEVKFFEPREIRLAVAAKTLRLTESALENLKAVGVLI